VGVGEAVLEAVRAACVFGEVAADGADGLRGGIGWVEVAVGGDGVGDVGVDDSGFDDDALVWDVDGEGAVHAGEADDDAAGDGERSAAEAGASSAGDEGDLVLGADADDGLDLSGGARKDDGGGKGAEGRQTVALIGLELGGLGDEAGGVVVEGGAKGVEDGGVEHEVMILGRGVKQTTATARAKAKCGALPLRFAEGQDDKAKTEEAGSSLRSE
jgi:hypothetical protein